jgi:hypothetical protein
MTLAADVHRPEQLALLERLGWVRPRGRQR